MRSNEMKGLYMREILDGFFMAWGNFSAIPCPKKVWNDNSKKWMLSLMALVGVIIGALLVCANACISFFVRLGAVSYQPFIFGVVLMLIFTYATGFIHLDGFMDCCDAILSRRDKQERQRILKDSNVGAFAVISVVLTLMCQGAAFISISMSGFRDMGIFVLTLICVCVRALAAGDIMSIKPLKVSQYAYKNESIRQRKPLMVSKIIFLVTILIGVATIVVFKYDLKLIFAPIIAGSLAQIASRMTAVKSLGGINGDIAGYSIVVGETAGLLTLGSVL